MDFYGTFFLILLHTVKTPNTCSNNLLNLIMRGAVWLFVQWFEEIQIRFIYFFHNKRVVPQFEVCMGVLASCCARLSVHYNFFTRANCQVGGFRHLSSMKLWKKLKLMPGFLWPCMGAFRQVAWNGTVRTYYGLEEKLRFPKRKSRWTNLQMTLHHG